VKAAYRQLNCTFDLCEIDVMLDMQYSALGKRREHLRDHLFDWIQTGLGECSPETREFLGRRMSGSDETRTLLARALDELIENDVVLDAPKCAQAFNDLISALRDREEVDPDAEGDFSEESAIELWSNLAATLHEEYGAQRGTFARPDVRRNQAGDTTDATTGVSIASTSFPRVLVAQSMVGRKDLTCHQRVASSFCSTPNGTRVSSSNNRKGRRVGSCWEKELGQAISAARWTTILPRYRDLSCYLPRYLRRASLASAERALGIICARNCMVLLFLKGSV